MKTFPDHWTGQVLTIADGLLEASARHGEDRTFAPALLLYQILSDIDAGGMTVADKKDLARVCGRIDREMTIIDQPEFSSYDYADAIANARQPISFRKLLALDEESFTAAMTWLAIDKRETYCGEEHAQEPLDIDIYA